MFSKLLGCELHSWCGWRNIVGRIKAFFISIPFWALVLSCGPATASEVRVSTGDWVLAADASAGTFSVDAGPLGRLLQNGRFWVRDENGMHEAKSWTIQPVKDVLVV